MTHNMLNLIFHKISGTENQIITIEIKEIFYLLEIYPVGRQSPQVLYDASQQTDLGIRYRYLEFKRRITTTH